METHDPGKTRLCAQISIPNFLAEDSVVAEEAADKDGLPFSVFFRVICGIREGIWILKFLAEAGENAEEAGEGIYDAMAFTPTNWQIGVSPPVLDL